MDSMWKRQADQRQKKYSELIHGERQSGKCLFAAVPCESFLVNKTEQQERDVPCHIHGTIGKTTSTKNHKEVTEH